MAAIDKIYGTKAQRIELGEWLMANRAELTLYLSPLEFWEKPDWATGEHWISCFTVRADIWLAQNCPIPWVLDALKEQYGGDLPAPADL